MKTKFLAMIVLMAMVVPAVYGCGYDEDWKVGPPGPAGVDGADGAQGPQGAAGLSAYEIAVRYGFEGSEEDWYRQTMGLILMIFGFNVVMAFLFIIHMVRHPR